ncbi:MAG: hypothetical protein SFX73_39250 [Kofleriaceae bacterium]|nr:hypothetical protein [Kofleriaceae bacterium]
MPKHPSKEFLKAEFRKLHIDGQHIVLCYLRALHVIGDRDLATVDSAWVTEVAHEHPELVPLALRQLAIWQADNEPTALTASPATKAGNMCRNRGVKRAREAKEAAEREIIEAREARAVETARKTVDSMADDPEALRLVINMVALYGADALKERAA